MPNVLKEVAPVEPREDDAASAIQCSGPFTLHTGHISILVITVAARACAL